MDTTSVSRLTGHTVEYSCANKVALSALSKHPRYGTLLHAAMRTWGSGVNVCRGQYGVASAESGLFTLTAESACLIGAALVGTSCSAPLPQNAATLYELRSGEVDAIIIGMDCPSVARQARALTEEVVVTNLEAFEFGLALASALGLPFTHMSPSNTKET